MKMFLLITVAVAAFSLQALAEDSPQPPTTLEVINAVQAQSLDASKQLTLRFWFQQLMLSALYRNVVNDSSLDEWQQALSSQSRIYCRYSSVARLAIPERRTLTFDEALFPLPSEHYPECIFIKHDQRVLRLAKYDPWVLYKLVSESGFSLYGNLSTVERTLF